MTDATTFDTTTSAPATPPNPEQINPTERPVTTSGAVVPEPTVEEQLLSRLRTSVAAWPDTYALTTDDGELTFTLGDGTTVIVTVEVL